MSLRRRLSGMFVVVAAIVSCAIVPATAQAALLDSVEEGAGTAAQPAQNAAGGVLDSAAGIGPTAATRPVPGPAASAPGPDDGAVQQTVAPIAGATEAAVPAAAPAAASGHLREPHRSRVHRISASAASMERLSSARGERAERTSGAAAAAHRPGFHSLAGIASSRQSSASAAPVRAASAPGLPAPEPSSGLGGGDAVPSGSTGFSFGGGLALLVAAFLLAGPRLRRRLSLLLAVCRPVGFHVVLERPG